MKPVDQERFGKPHGDCFPACVASILEVPLDSLYRDELARAAAVEPNEGAWWDAVVAMLRDFGYGAWYAPAAWYPGRAPQGWSIVSGTAERGLQHSCVAFHGRILHDPHPSRSGLLDVASWIKLVPLGGDCTLLPTAEDPK